MDDDFGADSEFLEALAASDPSRPQPPKPLVQQPVPQRARTQAQQPTPQRLDKPAPASVPGPKAAQAQPTPQALPQRSSRSAIQVSPRQRGNPVLAALRSLPWEYSDIPADYVLGLTTCALFLSLKYHRLHPEYIYQRTRKLQGKYNLRILLTLVDIPNHEDSLRELSKTSIVNNVTIILCWSAAEAARYLELYKSYEHANFSAIRGQQSSSYAEKLVDFVTVPRSVNKADAIALVSNFGSLRDAVNADPDQIGVIAGWGPVKVRKWVAAVEEPFRAKKAAKRNRDPTTTDGEGSGAGTPSVLDQAVPIGRVPLRDMPVLSASSSRATPASASDDPAGSRGGKQKQLARDRVPGMDGVDMDDEEAMIAAAIEESKRTAEAEASQRTGSGPAGTSTSGSNGDSGGTTGESGGQLSEGIAAALARLRQNA
ncbi:hypothetical protein SODALDRAFT_329100 [Sodiomyces alkalinus F11]|uniref:ERCC1-like central domain-containing protein n=1 Tax=Sodiomyces alkalinus (strain CBS 110278 / VKM F-3762 / F11) TaxID=1314773 RepID=A0A3N2PK66_SODAK|nr:hypothetical protein SODALDRAFT_329100 [Sodiomyces alkalinus F11]ROT34899.1 hypothetical protein SODALDRAFT_329100 [Sodiomyces alkalinus F11]